MGSAQRSGLRAMRTDPRAGLIGRHPAFLRALDLAEVYGRRRGHVLITGPTGCGKTDIARMIHHNSDRSAAPFIAVNCAAIRPELAELQLFGAEKGAFTGAVRTTGHFDAAHKGTLFWDEIAELPPDVQAKSLRAVETGAFHRLGSTEEVIVDVRLVVATHADLHGSPRFRADLLGRLARYHLQVPGLADRGDDVLLIAGHFMETDPDLMPFSLDPGRPEIRGLLMGHTWPRGVRELQALLSMASAEAEMEGQEEISAAHLRRCLGQDIGSLAGAGGQEAGPIHMGRRAADSDGHSDTDHGAKPLPMTSQKHEAVAWISASTLAGRLGVSSRAVREAFAAAQLGRPWRGVALKVAERPSTRGGRPGGLALMADARSLPVAWREVD